MGRAGARLVGVPLLGEGKDLVLHRPDRKTVAPLVVALRIDAFTEEAQVPSEAGREERGRPVVAIGTTEVPRRPIAVAGR